LHGVTMHANSTFEIIIIFVCGPCSCLQHDGTGRATRNEGVCSTGCCSGDVGEFNDGKVDVKFGNCEACKTQECTTQACKLRIVVIVGTSF